ncbi:unnamed protein product [Zymoseptoria tritici ST99CH_1A5]|uniref:Uncharacterized protein n=2 Tax=Zymoseptoria tritici TaxID=1047171 RepID=A0A2H1FJV0_ZYMTR|nr:unnamed protein product [Zymoseptoria tritici ST99CH_1E4]SMR43794.1 unnamed protein product [Zymoseptoria tritici ST99CH_3D1]SMY18954.1 unnamed protein product [Zymoseptoria tritici ST99CH_1A5]
MKLSFTLLTLAALAFALPRHQYDHVSTLDTDIELSARGENKPVEMYQKREMMLHEMDEMTEDCEEAMMEGKSGDEL